MKPQPAVELQTGIFTISLDFELIWGTLDKAKHKRFRRLCAIERAVVIDRLLALFDEYKVSASWCTVGHLFLDRNHRSGVRANDTEAPIFYGRDLVEKIRSCRTPQEIGSHSFTHRIFDDPLCTRSVAKEEFANSVRSAQEIGLELKSFVYPRNRIGHVDLLPRYGFTSFRGRDANWYSDTSQRRWFHRAGHLIDMFCATTPPTVMPHWHEAGLWEIPGSMLYTPSHGLRCIVPAAARVCRARKGLRAAADQKRIFHLWFHPTDVVVRNEAMLDGLRQILKTAADLRDAGRISILSMGGVTDLMNSQLQAACAAPAMEGTISR